MPAGSDMYGGFPAGEGFVLLDLDADVAGLLRDTFRVSRPERHEGALGRQCM